MSLAPFYSRIADAIGPLTGNFIGLNDWLSERSVALIGNPGLEESPANLAGFELAVNLCSRLYPRLHIVSSKDILDRCATLALSINPLCEIDDRPSSRCDAALAWGTRNLQERSISISAAGWNVFIDTPQAENLHSTNMLTGLFAGAVGVSEMFRTVFGRFLSSAREVRSGTVFNLLTLTASPSDYSEFPEAIRLGRVHLAGAGAIGQALLYALRHLPVSGTLVVVDPETLTSSNLQRYVLSGEKHVGISKCTIAGDALAGSALNVVLIESAWGQDEATIEGVETVCTALDTAEARIGVQAGLPRTIYNAWTQPADVGWSRHERFGVDPCLACLYIPDRAKPSQHELIAKVLKQPELRILAYLTSGLPVDVPLTAEQIPQLPNYPIPPDASTWIERPILDDIADLLRVTRDQVVPWQGKRLGDLYREGICGGALVTDQRGELPGDMAVPLAHQSVVAGLMLA